VNRGDWLIDQLPLVMAEDDFLRGFVGIFQDLADSLLVHADNMEHVIDTSVAPDAMVRFMGEWIGAGGVGDGGIDPALDVAHQRRIVREHGRALPWRGTARSLERLLILVTGEPVEVTDSGGVYREGEAPDNAVHVVVRMASSGAATDDDVLELVQAEVPVSASFEVQIGDRLIWPPATILDAPSPAAALPAAPVDPAVGDGPVPPAPA
jgi:phage tail-like protein